MNVVALREGCTDACSCCGAGTPRVHSPKRHMVWISCTACTARTAAFLIDEDNPLLTRDRALDRAWEHWRRAPLVIATFEKQRGASARLMRRRGSHEDELDILEILARLLVSTSYREPEAGRGTAPSRLTMTDVAAALGFVKDRLAKAVALAVVTRADEVYIAMLTDLARWRVRREVLMQRPVPLKFSAPADRWKLRMVLFDAAYELVWPERRTPYGELARRAKMRKSAYIVVHRCATHVLQDALNKARGELKAQVSGG